MEERARERRVGARVEGERIGREDSLVSVLEVRMVWLWRLGGRGLWGEVRKREARAKRCRFCRMRMSQSTSSSRMSAVVRFCSTTLQ